MRHVVLSFVLALFTALPVAANMRAPYALDGTFTEHVRGAHPDAVLMRERFVAHMPALVNGVHGQDFYARVEVEYDIDNVSTVPLTIPVRFLAIGAKDATVRVNREVVPVTRVADEDERRAARLRVAQHRCAWSEHDIKGLFIRNCDATKASDPAVDAKGVDERYAESIRYGDESTRLDSFAFDVVLEPGANAIRVEYAQRVRFREGAHGYFSGLGVRGAQYGFEYLLYPAESWRRAEGFTFDVVVEVPDVRERGLFCDSFVEPTVDTNLPLATARQEHASTLTGRLRVFPAEVFAVVVNVPPSMF